MVLSGVFSISISNAQTVQNAFDGGYTTGVPKQTPAPTTFTQGNGSPCPIGKICNPTTIGSIDKLLASILSIIKFVAGIVLVIYFILAGFKYVMARGDEGEIKKAHEMLKWTAIGGAILLGAEVIQKLISATISQLGTGL